MTSDQRTAAALKAAATRRSRRSGVRTPNLTTNPVLPIIPNGPTAPTSFVFGELATGRWGINPDAATNVWGKCGRCGCARPAIELALTNVPFKDAGHDYWGCASCR
jgi:hypothetical protein